jgi:DNA replication and repair protein RecF
MVSLLPHQSALRADYERVLKQRNALLKSARAAGRFSTARDSTLDVWDQHLAQAGARLLSARLILTDQLRPYVSSVSSSPDLRTDDDGGGTMPGTSGEGLQDLALPELTELFLASLLRHRKKELERGISLVGPHRDELALLLGAIPAKGYASHGETWSMALALRLASYYLLLEKDSTPGGDPVLILDDVFAELDAQRRTRLAAIVAPAEQVLVTAAVGDDIPGTLLGRQIRVVPGGIEGAEDADVRPVDVRPVDVSGGDDGEAADGHQDPGDVDSRDMHSGDVDV